jgi:hypothetical protein
MCSIGFVPNVTFCSVYKVLIALPCFLQYYFRAFLQTGCMFWNILIRYRLSSFHSVSYVISVDPILSCLRTQPLHSITFLKSPLSLC